MMKPSFAVEIKLKLDQKGEKVGLGVSLGDVLKSMETQKSITKVVKDEHVLDFTVDVKEMRVGKDCEGERF